MTELLEDFPLLSPEKLGYIIGVLVCIVPALIGFIKCLRIMRRPTTSTLCVLALAMVLLAWFTSASNAASKLFFGTNSMVWSLVVAFVCLILMITAIVLSIVGLATYNRETMVQGRKQAIWALVLGSVFTLIALSSAVVIAMERFGPPATNDLTEFRENSSKTSVAPLNPFQRVESEKGNCSVLLPSGWFTLRAEAFNPLACLAFRKPSFGGSSVIIAEETGGEISLEAMMDGVKINLASRMSVENQHEEYVTLNGFRFARITSHATLPTALQQPLYFESWVLSSGSSAWQIETCGPVKDKLAVEKDARWIAESFRILDATRANTGGPGSLTDVDKVDLGYSTLLASMGWNKWPNCPLPMADFAALRLNEAIVVTPIYFGADIPELPALSRGLLSQLAISYEDHAADATAFTCPGGEGLEFKAERVVDGNHMRYILRVVRGQRMAWLAAGWAERDKGNHQLVRDGLDRIKFTFPLASKQDLNPAQKHTLSIIFNEAGLYHERKQQFEPASHLFLRAFSLAEKDPVLARNAAECLLTAQKYDECRKVLDQVDLTFPANADLQLVRASLELNTGAIEDSVKYFGKAVEHGLENEEGAFIWIGKLNSAGHSELVEQCAKLWLDKHPGLNAKRLYANALSSSGKGEKAIAILEEVVATYPKDLSAKMTLGEICNSVEQYSRAAEIAEAALKEDATNTRALMIQGWSEIGRKWYREAKASFEKAATLEPDNDDIQKSVKYASANLGQGDNSLIKTPIAPVAIPADLQKLLNAPMTPLKEGKPFQILSRAVGHHLEANKSNRRTTYQRVKVMTPEGVDQFSSLEFNFDPLSENIFVNKLTIIDADGKTKHGSTDDAYVMDASEGEIASHDKKLHLQVPGLEPGGIVEAVVTIEDKTSDGAIDFRPYAFTETQALIVFVTGDTSKIKHELMGSKDVISSTKTSEYLAWSAKDLPNFKLEPMALPWDQQIPMLGLCKDEGSWAAVAKAFLETIRDRLKPDEKASLLAKKLTTDLKTDVEKLTAITRHVQRQISYKAIEFGVRSRRPNAPTVTLQQRYGDCKDQSLLLHQMLSAVGIKSHLTLVNTGSTIMPSLPTLDQFNHMVVHVPMLGPEWLIDPTDKFLHLGKYCADYFWGNRALILDDENAKLVTLPLAPVPDTSNLHSERVITPVGSDWRVEEKVSLEGYCAAALRIVFAGINPDDIHARAQSLINSLGSAELEDVHLHALDDTTQPFKLELVYKIRNAINAEEKQYVSAAGIPAFWERDYLNAQFFKDRTTGFFLRYPLRIKSHMKVNLPMPAASASKNASAENPYCAWGIKRAPSTESDPAILDMHFDFQARTGKFPASEYAKFQDAWQSARAVFSAPLSWPVK